jgi:heme-degrading monooxygenase HmoA
MRKPTRGASIGSMAYLIVWEFRPRPGMEREFEIGYGPKGEWAALFATSEGFLGTQLFRDTLDPSRYLTLDRWVSREAFETFRQFHSQAYETLDRRFAELTTHEAALGSFDTVDG